MIDKTRISELRRIYCYSNNEAYRTVNQLLDEIERLNEERRTYQSPLAAAVYRLGEPSVLDLSKYPIQAVTRIDEEPQAEMGVSVDEVQTEHPSEQKEGQSNE